MDIKPIDLTSIIVAFISSASTIISAIIVTRGKQEKGSGRREKDSAGNAVYVLLAVCLGAAALACLRSTKAVQPTLAFLVCAICCAVQEDGSGIPPAAARRSLLPDVVYYASVLILVASFSVLTWRNPEPGTIAALCCAVSAAALTTYSVHLGAMNLAFKVLVVISAVLLIGGLSTVTVMAVTGENGEAVEERKDEEGDKNDKDEKDDKDGGTTTNGDRKDKNGTGPGGGDEDGTEDPGTGPKNGTEPKVEEVSIEITNPSNPHSIFWRSPDIPLSLEIAGTSSGIDPGQTITVVLNFPNSTFAYPSSEFETSINEGGDWNMSVDLASVITEKYQSGLQGTIPFNISVHYSGGIYGDTGVTVETAIK